MLPYSPTMCGALEMRVHWSSVQVHNHHHQEVTVITAVATVICQGNTTSQSECSSGNFCLVDGQRESEDRVEICVKGFWGTVCDSGWDQTEALVVCRQSGFGTRGRNVFYG